MGIIASGVGVFFEEGGDVLVDFVIIMLKGNGGDGDEYVDIFFEMAEVGDGFWAEGVVSVLSDIFTDEVVSGYGIEGEQECES